MASPSPSTTSSRAPLQLQAKAEETSSPGGQSQLSSATMMQPQRNQSAAGVAMVGGIGGAASAYQSQSQPSAINNNYVQVQSQNSNNNGSKNNNNNINSSNIFASMSEPDQNNAQHSNNMFHNFATMSSGPVSGSGGIGIGIGQMNHVLGGPTTIPYRTYSSNSRGRVVTAPSNMIGAFAGTQAAAAAAAASGSIGIGIGIGNNGNINRHNPISHRSESEGLSKSMGTPSFMKNSQRQMSECETDPSNTIRYAGYLLKRSNMPYTMPSNVTASTSTTILSTSITTTPSSVNVGGIAPLPDLSALDDSNHSAVHTLPFNGLNGNEGGDHSGTPGAATATAVISDIKSSKGILLLDNRTPISVTPEDDAVLSANIIPSTTVEEKPCFCSPIVLYLEKIFCIQRPSDALVISKNDTNDGNNKRSRSKRSSRTKKKPTSPKPTRPMPIAPKQISSSYIMDLKPPAPSDPMPISPATDRPNATTMLLRQESGTGNESGGGHLSRSFSNGGKIIIPTVASATPTKDYPPKPEDYIDPKDGHIWRAKYCVLEEGILYFYRTAEEGESEDARIERYESRLYDVEGEDIVLGEVVNVSSSPRGSFAAMKLASSRRMSSLEERKSSSKDLFDLSKSPVPMKKSDLFFEHFKDSPFHRSGSSVLTGYSSRSGSSVNDNGGNKSATKSSPLLHHSNSLSTFHADADILWEKRVALDCVGAVRSSEQEHGHHAFELLAYGSDEMENEESDVSTGASGIGSAMGQKQEIIDRLILRAGSSDDMHGWMFEFHRSLVSYVQQIVNSVGRGSAGTGARGDILGIRSDAPNHRRLNSGGKSTFVAKQHSFATSPTPGGGSFHESGFSSNFVGSLSHGHGRNALYRRQVRDKDKAANLTVSPLATPVGTPNGGSSPIDSAHVKKKPFVSSMMQSDSPKDKVNLPTLKDLREGKTEKKAGDASAPVSAAAAAAPKKYIPPHMRNKGASPSAAPQKWIPPHMRRKLAEIEKQSNIGDNGAPSVAKTSEVKEVPLNDSPKKEAGRSSSELFDESFSDSAFSAASASSLLSRQLEEEDNTSASITVRLGGCADPAAIVGSIVDHHYIGRKASVVGNARLDAYGGTGGGSFSSFDQSHHCPTTSEEKSMMFDDLDLESTNKNTNGHRKSVLKWEVGASSECGIRSSNEDSYVAINNLDVLIEKEGLVSFSQQDLGGTRQQGLYCIFDGHVGNQAARYSAEKFPGILIEEESVLASQDSACSIEERAETVLRKAFHRLDEDFCHLCTKDGREWDCGSTALVALIVDDVVSLANLGDCRGVVCRRVSENVSSTETDGWEPLGQEQEENQHLDRVYGGDASTSRGKLLWKEITETHSPLFDGERARIENANGWIIEETEIPIGQLHRMDIFDEDVVDIVKRCFADRMKHHRSDPVRQLQIARTCGDLAVSRAIGDRDFKAAYNMPGYYSANRNEMLARSWEGPLVFIYPEGHSGRFRGDLVSTDPDIKSFKVGQSGVKDEFLLMACDGLWDVMDGDDAVRIAKELLFDKKMSAKEGAARLAELAQHLGSSDNITVILIRFYWVEEEDLEEDR